MKSIQKLLKLNSKFSDHPPSIEEDEKIFVESYSKNEITQFPDVQPLNIQCVNSMINSLNPVDFITFHKQFINVWKVTIWNGMIYFIHAKHEEELLSKISRLDGYKGYRTYSNGKVDTLNEDDLICVLCSDFPCHHFDPLQLPGERLTKRPEDLSDVEWFKLARYDYLHTLNMSYERLDV